MILFNELACRHSPNNRYIFEYIYVYITPGKGLRPLDAN